MNDRVPASPFLTHLIKRALLIFVPALLIAAALFPAPLEIIADPADAPNPAKSAWFLLWIQEVVSHGTTWVYPIIIVAFALGGLPWWRTRKAERAAWFQAGERVISAMVLIGFLCILVLTLVAMFCRGPDWRWLG